MKISLQLIAWCKQEKLPWLIILGSLVLTYLIWIFSKTYEGDYFNSGWWYVSKTAALGSVILMSWSVILSARFSFIENLFGGLDKVYQIHKKCGKYAFYLILIHPVALALRYNPSPYKFLASLGFQSWDNWYSLGHNFGIICLAIFFCLIAVSLWVYLPYHIWKATHNYFGLVYLIIILHVVLVDADIADYPVLKIWMYGIMALAAFSYLKIRFWYYHFGPKYSYHVTDLEQVEGVTEITLSPQSKFLHYRPGQFAYLKFYNSKIQPELHPYSFAYGPGTHGILKFGVKELGDHTQSLKYLQIGDKVEVFGPYGRFGEKFLTQPRECVLIGAGIGITPFLSIWDSALRSDEFLVEAMEASREGTFQIYDSVDTISWKSPIVHLFYVVKNKHEASFDNDIQQKAIIHQFKGKPHIIRRSHTYELFEADKQGYINASYIESKVGDLKNKNILICGPEVLTKALIKQLKELGVPNNQIITEDFKLLDEKRGLKLRNIFAKNR
ncbi:MAG: FAD-binding oxidoreductase [Patescibacteria group bacterium]